MPDRRELANVLREVRELLARPGNDFAWSSWADMADALREVDGLIRGLERGAPFSVFRGKVLFAPTGPIQEVSLSSGWANEFLALATRWDAALNAAKPTDSPRADCRCMTPPLDHRDYERRELGVDERGGRYADVAIKRCKRCGRTWLHYHYEMEAFTGSGRWYRGLVTPEQAARATPGNALEILAALPWHLYGGSYFGTTGKRSDVPLDPATV